MRNKRLGLMIVGAICLLSSRVLLADDSGDEDKVLRKGPPRSPLNFESSGSERVPDQESLQELAERLVGHPCIDLAYEFGVLTDQTPFGMPSELHDVWHIAGAAVNLSSGDGDETRLPIHLIVEDGSGRLVA